MSSPRSDLPRSIAKLPPLLGRISRVAIVSLMSAIVPSIAIVGLRAQEPSAVSSASDNFAPVEYASLLEPPSLVQQDNLQEDPANPFGLAPASSTPASSVVLDASTTSPESPARAAARDRDEALVVFSLDNALTRTALQNHRSTGDRFFDGFGGIARPSSSPLSPQSRPGEFLLHLGPVRFTPILGASYSANFGSSSGASSRFSGSSGISTGITRPSNRSGSDSDGGFGSLNAGLSAEIGEPTSGHFLTLDYGVAFNFGAASGEGDAPDQTLTLLGKWDFVRLKFGLGIAFDSLSGHDREFGGDVQRDLATVSFTTTYVHTPKTSVDLDLSMPISQYQGGIDSTGFTASTFANYHYSTKTTFGLGFSSGITSVSGSDSQTFQRVEARMSSTASPFISYTGTVGFEWRDTGDVQSTSPVFGVGVNYTPRTGTSFILTLDQQVENSAAIVESNFTTTSVTLSASQRLGDLANLGVALGYEHASYESTVSGQSVDRRDKTFFGQASLSRTFFQHLSLTGAVSYFHTESSDLPQQATQISVSATYVF